MTTPGARAARGGRALQALLARRVLAHAGPVVVAACVLAGLATATQARLTGMESPGVGVGLSGAASALGLALGAGALAGAAATARSLARGGAWTTLRASGARARDLLRGTLLPLALLASLHALAEHALAPRARAHAHARGLGVTAPAHARGVPGTTVRAGELALATDVDGRTRIAWGASIERAWSGSAAAWVLPERASSVKGREGATARLRGLELHAPDGVRLRAEELRVALPLGGNALPLAARSTGALFASPEPYARWIGAKRLLLPACGWTLAAGLLAAGLRFPRAPALVPVAGAFALVWALVRALDGGVRGGGLGVGWACASLLGAVGVATALAWARWRDA